MILCQLQLTWLEHLLNFKTIFHQPDLLETELHSSIIPCTLDSSKPSQLNFHNYCIWQQFCPSVDLIQNNKISQLSKTRVGKSSMNHHMYKCEIIQSSILNESWSVQMWDRMSDKDCLPHNWTSLKSPLKLIKICPFTSSFNIWWPLFHLIRPQKVLWIRFFEELFFPAWAAVSTRHGPGMDM